jgi:hypothetical protein
MSEAYVFEYEVTDALIADAAEAALVAQNAGRPPRRVRSLVVAESLICLQILIGLVVAVLAGAPEWIVVVGAAALLMFTIWTGLMAFTLFMYPRNRRRYERLIRAAYERLDSPWVRFRFGDDGFVVESRTTFRQVAWADVGTAVVGRTFWILAAGGHGHLLLPASALPPWAERYLLDRLAGSAVGCGWRGTTRSSGTRETA